MRKVFPHAAIILSLMYFVFFGIDRVNPIMAFIDNDITKVLLCVLGVVSIVNAVLLIAEDRKRARRRLERERRRQKAKAAAKRRRA